MSAHRAPKTAAPPAVSVLFPCHNGGTYLRTAIGSVLSQSFEDFELLIVDDGSSDDSPGILNEMAARDSRVRVIRQPHSGIVLALSRAASMARGKYLARMDADDCCHPDRFARQVALMEQRPEIVALDCGYALIDENGRALKVPARASAGYALLPKSDLFRPYPQAVFLCHPATMMRRDAYERVGGYRDTFRDAEDCDLWLRLEEVGELARINECLFQWRRHSQRTSVMRLHSQIKRHVGAVVCAQLRRSGQADHDVGSVPYEAFEYALFADPQIQQFCEQYAAALMFERPFYNQSLRYDHAVASRYFETNFRIPQSWLWRGSGGKHLRYRNHSLFLVRRMLGHYARRKDIGAMTGIGILLLKHAGYIPRHLRALGGLQRRRGARPRPRTPDVPLQVTDAVKERVFEPTYTVRYHPNATSFDPVHQTFHILQNWPVVYAECSKNACTTMKRALFYMDTLNQSHFHDLPESRVHSKRHTGFLGRLDMDDDQFVEHLVSRDWLRICIKRNPYERLYSAWADKVQGARKLPRNGDRLEYCRWLEHFRDLQKPGIDSRGADPPEFGQFVRYLGDVPKQDMDRHWYPQVGTMHADAISYDIVGDVRHMGSFALRLRKEIGFPLLVVGHFLEVHNATGAGQSGRWRSGYDQELADIVYRIYREDFEWGSFARESWRDER